MKMEIWLTDENTGIECGINGYGQLFFGDDKSGYNMTDTLKNRKKIIDDFCKATGREQPVIGAGGAPIKYDGSMVDFSR